MKVGKGNVPEQRRRRRDRYRGCRVCGVRGVHCTECGLGEQIVAVHGYARLALVVDGSFVESPTSELGYGGAGLVLTRGNEILASRACGFRVASSSEAEHHAVVRAARWAPGVAIYTDARELPVTMTGVNPHLTVHYLRPDDRRTEAYVLAHRLSVEGRCREAPESIPPSGLAFALERSLTRAQRKARGADLLLEHARKDPAFDGDFFALAERLGWNSGRSWRDNPSIRVAAQRWSDGKSKTE